MDYASMLNDLARWNGLFGGGIPSQADIEAAMRGEIDAETRALMGSYTSRLDRRTVTHQAACIDPDTWSVDNFAAVIENFITSVPANERAGARVEFKGGYEETSELVIEYERPQTDEEWGLDIAHALMHARKHQAADIADYERLRRKFG